MASWIGGERFDEDAPNALSLLVIALVIVGLVLEAWWAG
jgi:hypothetical protein